MHAQVEVGGVVTRAVLLLRPEGIAAARLVQHGATDGPLLDFLLGPRVARVEATHKPNLEMDARLLDGCQGPVSLLQAKSNRLLGKDVQAVLSSLDDVSRMIHDACGDEHRIQIGIAEQLVVIGVVAFGVVTLGHLLGHLRAAAGDGVQAGVRQLGDVAGVNLSHISQSHNGDA